MPFVRHIFLLMKCAKGSLPLLTNGCCKIVGKNYNLRKQNADIAGPLKGYIASL